MEIITWEEWDKLGELSRDIIMKWNWYIRKFELYPVKGHSNYNINKI